MKKIELVIDAGSLPIVKSIISKSGAKGYSVLNVIEGQGEIDGHKKAIPELSSFEQYYLVIVCTGEIADKLIDGLTPFIAEIGGVLFTSPIELYISK